MAVVDDQLDAKDLDRLSEGMVESLPTSLFSMLGVGFARSAWRYFQRAETEFVLVERLDGDIQAVAMISVERNSLAKRILLGTDFLLRLPLHILKHSVRKSLFGSSDSFNKDAPEVVILFTLPGLRSQGLGAKLIERSETLLKQHGFTEVFVRTSAASDNLARQFYGRQGYIEEAAFRSQGQDYVCLAKQLNP